MKKIYVFLICLLGIGTLSHAQQIPNTTQYLVNPYSLNTSYAGLGDGFEAYISYKKQSINYDYTPRTMGLSLNASVGKKVGLGLSLVNDKSGVFNTIYGSASYTYHVKLATDHNLGLSLSAGIANKNIDLTGVMLDPTNYNASGDPVIRDIGTGDNKTSTYIGAGLLYRWKTLQIGASLPYLTTFNEYIFYYSLKQTYIAHASYDWEIDDNWNLEPWFIARGTENAPWTFDVAVLAKFKQMLWFGINYRKNTIMGAIVGGEIAKGLILHYTYNFAMPFDEYKGPIGDDKETHDITIGYHFGARKKKDQDLEEMYRKKSAEQIDSLMKVTQAVAVNMKSLNDSIADVNRAYNDELKKTNDDLMNYTKNIDDQVSKLNSQLDSLNNKLERQFKTYSTRGAVRTDRDGSTSSVDAGYYTVIASFRNESNAKRALEIYKAHNAFYIYNAARAWYYVYTDKFDNLEDGLARMKELRKGEFTDSWVHIYR